MATENGPDLEPARLAVEALMDDTCRITRGGGLSVDPDTLLPVASGGEVLYPVGAEDGRCTLSAVDNVASEGQVGGQDQTSVRYALKLPRDVAPRLRTGDVVLMTSSRRDPLVPGATFVIDEQLVKTMSVSSKVLLTRRGANQ